MIFELLSVFKVKVNTLFANIIFLQFRKNKYAGTATSKGTNLVSNISTKALKKHHI